MKNRLFNNESLLTFLEKSLLIIIFIFIFASAKISTALTNISSNKLTISSVKNQINYTNTFLEDYNKSDNISKDTSWITFEMWMNNCASVSNIYIYDNTNKLKLLSEKTQEQLDELSKNFKIQTNGNIYNSVVKFIIIDKSKGTFLTNDTANLDYIKNNIKTFSQENGDLFNYVSRKGKWYNISYNSDSAPASKYGGNHQLINATNYVEAYWFPKDYTYSNDDDALLKGILEASKKNLNTTIQSSNNYINELESDITKQQIYIIIYSIIDLLTLISLYLLGKERIISGLRYNFLTNSIRSINDWVESKNTLFKLSIFIIFSAISLIMVVFVLFNLHLSSIRLITPYVLFILFYLIFIFRKAISFSRYLDKIIKGIGKITSGELEHVIDETGDISLSKLAHNINKLNKGFKVSIEEQIKNEKLKSELVANVSHDLKTPLTSIISYTDILLREDISEEEKEEFLKIINRKGLKLKSLIEDLFEISKITSGKAQLNKHNVDVVELIGQSIAEYSDTDIYSDKHLSFVFNTFKSKIEMDLDGNNMSRVFENLITNALKYSLNDTRVHVEIEDIKKGIKISFKNTSSTPLDFDKAEILERFVRGDRSRNSDIDGNGLGLAIAKSIVELHGGIMYLDFDCDLFKCIIELYY